MTRSTARFSHAAARRALAAAATGLVALALAATVGAGAAAAQSSAQAKPKSAARPAKHSAKPAKPAAAAARPAAARADSTPPVAAAPAPTVVAAEAAGAQGRDSLAVTNEEYQGWKTFHVYCYRCHGVDALGSDLAPNLRHSVGPEGSVTHDVFMTTVKEGRLAKGMPTWKELLTDEKIEQLYAYVKARSDKRLAAGRPHVAKTGN